jgi:O-antigen ligase
MEGGMNRPPATLPQGTGSVAPGAFAAPETPRENWLLYGFLFLLPLQNLQTGYMPNLGGGLNFLNVGFALAMLGAWRCHGRLAKWSSLHRWILAYTAYSLVSLLISYGAVSNTENHFNMLKDALLAVMIVFLVQISVTGWASVRHVLLVTVLPLPYILRVTWSQHASVSHWHYSDVLRISGTFSLLGANEYASFCVTSLVLLLALLVGTRWDWRWRALFVIGIACTLFGVLWAYSRTSYIALMLGAATVLLLWRGRWKVAVPLLVLAMALPAILPPSVVERFDSTTLEGSQVDESTEMRFEFWQIAWENFLAHPLTGSGYHTFQHPEINPMHMDTHNFFMRELTEKGLIGVTITVGMLLSILVAAVRTWRDAPPGSLAQALGLGMIGVWLSLMLSNVFGDRFTYYPMIGYFWAYVGLMLKSRELALAEGARAGVGVPVADRRPRLVFAQPRERHHV